MSLLKEAIKLSKSAPETVPLVSRIFTGETAEAYLASMLNS